MVGGVGWSEIGGGIRPAVDTFCLVVFQRSSHMGPRPHYKLKETQLSMANI